MDSPVLANSAKSAKNHRTARELHSPHIMWTHWTARSNYPYEPFREFADCQRTWKYIARGFPGLLAAILMPNHVHLIIPNSVPRRRLSDFLGQVARATRTPGLWQPVPELKPIPDRQYLKRMIRYVALNPCRKQLCRDPLEWQWSTYRELFGAVAFPLVSSDLVAATIGENARDFSDRFHRYVSSDPAVRVDGTTPPIPAKITPFASYPIHDILLASAAALRVAPQSVRKPGPMRRLFLQLAARHNWRKPKQLAEICQIGVSTIQWNLRQPSSSGISAGDFCLGDLRLRSGLPPFHQNS